MIENIIGELLTPFAVFGGIALLVWTSAKAKLEHRKLDLMAQQPILSTLPNDPILAGLKELKQQMAEMQSTGHQFDISFDEALNRIEGRVNRLETKSAVATAQTAETPTTLRNGQNS